MEAGGQTAAGKDSGDLEQDYPRAEGDFLLVGDQVHLDGQEEAEQVQNFLCERNDRQEPDRYDDMAVLSPVGNSTALRRVPVVEAEAERTSPVGRRPVLRLQPDRVSRPSEAVSRRLRQEMDRKYLSTWRQDKRVGISALESLEAVTGGGYDIFLTGGLVRDAIRLSGGRGGEEGDVDCVGSVPPGTFCERIREVVGRAEVPKRFNPRSGVVAVFTDPRRKERFLEYAALREPGDEIRFGTDMEADAEWRDLTVNTLSYDWRANHLIDPTGQGLADIGEMRLRPPGKAKNRPGYSAEKLFRFLKFADRWPDAQRDDLTAVIDERFDRIREDMEMLSPVEIERGTMSLGLTPEMRRRRAIELCEMLAPEHPWASLFGHGGGAEP